MNASTKRVERLEKQVRGNGGIVVLFANAGECTRDCVVRHGHDPDAPGVHYIVVSWETGDQAL